MFKKLFERRKGSLPQETASSSTTTSSRTIAELNAPVSTVIRLQSFKEQWAQNWESSHSIPAPEVIEGDGGQTDWGEWSDAVQALDDAFAPTEPMALLAFPEPPALPEATTAPGTTSTQNP